jgi:hypothetical protein
MRDVDFAWENNEEDSPTYTFKRISRTGEAEDAVTAWEEEEF